MTLGVFGGFFQTILKLFGERGFHKGKYSEVFIVFARAPNNRRLQDRGCRAFPVAKASTYPLEGPDVKPGVCQGERERLVAKGPCNNLG